MLSYVQSIKKVQSQPSSKKKFNLVPSLTIILLQLVILNILRLTCNVVTKNTVKATLIKYNVHFLLRDHVKLEDGFHSLRIKVGVYKSNGKKDTFIHSICRQVTPF